MPESEQRFIARVKVQCPAHELFAWHQRPGAFQRLMPPWERLKVLSSQGGIRDGGRLVFAVKKGPFWLPWEALHGGYVEDREFTDTQERGPFSAWKHTHRCLPDSQGRPDFCALEDEVRYRLPMGRVGQAVGGRTARRMLARMFAFRHRRTRDDLERHAQFAEYPRQRVVVSGGTGFLGSALVPFLAAGGHRVDLLCRPESSARFATMGLKTLSWDPGSGTIDADAVDGADVMVHLGGRGVADSRWTRGVKEDLIRSRVESTALLCRTIAQLPKKPRVLLCASAVGVYGARGDEPLTESSPPGDGFLADLARRWESATEPARDAGVRVVNLRIGVVLGTGGGALGKVLLPFRMGLGGRFGDGRQFMPWIALDDAVGAIHHCMFVESLSGPVNIVAPRPERNADFAATLARVVKRPSGLTLPSWAIRTMLGAMGREVLLGGSRALPSRLTDSQFQFLHPDLESGLRAELGLASTAPAPPVRVPERGTSNSTLAVPSGSE